MNGLDRNALRAVIDLRHIAQDSQMRKSYGSGSHSRKSLLLDAADVIQEQGEKLKRYKDLFGDIDSYKEIKPVSCIKTEVFRDVLLSRTHMGEDNEYYKGVNDERERTLFELEKYSTENYIQLQIDLQV